MSQKTGEPSTTTDEPQPRPHGTTLLGTFLNVIKLLDFWSKKVEDKPRPYSVTIPGKFVYVTALEKFLEKKFGVWRGQYMIKIQYNQCTIETDEELSREDIRQFTSHPKILPIKRNKEIL